jgi:hypothetical protein
MSVFEDVIGDYLAAIKAIDRSPYVLKEHEEQRLRAEAEANFAAKYEDAITSACATRIAPIEQEISSLEQSARGTTTVEIELRAQRLARQASEAGDAAAIQAAVEEARLTGHEDTMRSVLTAASDRHRALTSGRAATEIARSAREAFELSSMAWRQQHPSTSDRLAKLRSDREAAIAATVRDAQHTRAMALSRARKTVVTDLSQGQA